MRIRKYRLRIGIDVRCLANEHKSGVEFYIESLAKHVPKIATDLQFYFFVDRRFSRLDYDAIKNNNIKVIKIPFVNERKYWRIVYIYQKILHLRAFHFPISMIPIDLKIPNIITIYDLTYEKFPEFYSKHELWLQKKYVKEAAKKAWKILTISKSTKNDLIHYYKIDENKITVAYPSIRQNKNKTKKARVIPSPYFLFVGNIQPRKNLVNAMKAFSRLSKKYRFAIVGKPQDENEVKKIKKIITENNMSNRVTFFGYANNSEVANLYSNALALVLPSFYEGFGYTVIEGFFYKIPVITSQVSSMAEIAGNAAMLVDPNSVSSIASAMKKIADDKSLRLKLSKLGSIRYLELSKHSPYKTIANVYREAAK